MTLFQSKLYLLGLFAACGAATAQTGNPFPLDPGNPWVYRLTGVNPQLAFRTIAVEGRETVNGIEYSRVRFFERNVLLRAKHDGSLVAFDRDAGSDVQWAPLQE